LPFHLSVCAGTKVGVKLVGALAISPSDATYVVEWKPALKCVNARLIFLTLTINAIKKINCLAALIPRFLIRLFSDPTLLNFMCEISRRSEDLFVLCFYGRGKINTNMASSIKLQVCMRRWKPFADRVNYAVNKRFSSILTYSECRSVDQLASELCMWRRWIQTTGLSCDRCTPAVPFSAAAVSNSKFHRDRVASLTQSAKRYRLGPILLPTMAAYKCVNLSTTNGYMTQHYRNLFSVRAFSTASNDAPDDSWPSSGNNDGSEGSGSDEGPGIPGGGNPDLQPPLSALSPMTVPEVWPRVPVIAVRRHPLFPRFIKMIEVTF